MKLVLMSTDDCQICADAAEKFKIIFKKEIDKGEAQVVNLDQDEQAQEIWITNDLPLAPVIVLLTDDNRVISNIEPEDMYGELKQSKPATAEAVKDTTGSSGEPIK